MKKVSYFYDEDTPHHYYGPGHPMKPARLKLTHHLVLGYNLHREMDMLVPHKASAEEMCQYHSEDYINFLKKTAPGMISTKLTRSMNEAAARFNVGEMTDCPVFDGLFNFCSMYTGGSIDAATRLNHGLSDIAINWSGGLHHAKKSEASGFCYVNDIVLAILELLKYNPRVLYVDIDIHHGDGVEDAFWFTDRVMTCSFHLYKKDPRNGDFFPGTGAVNEIGGDDGKHTTVNFPLKEGIDDDTYFNEAFMPVISKIMSVYKPSAVVLQCGADSLYGDRLGRLQLSVEGHARCVQFIKSFNLPLLVLGGGGYTIQNVARCWAHETAVLLDKVSEIPETVPANDYLSYFETDFNLTGLVRKVPPNLRPTNQNSPEYLASVRNSILESLARLQGAPSVSFRDIPPDSALRLAIEEQTPSSKGVRDPIATAAQDDEQW